MKEQGSELPPNPHPTPHENLTSCAGGNGSLKRNEVSDVGWAGCWERPTPSWWLILQAWVPEQRRQLCAAMGGAEKARSGVGWAGRPVCWGNGVARIALLVYFALHPLLCGSWRQSRRSPSTSVPNK